MNKTFRSVLATSCLLGFAGLALAQETAPEYYEDASRLVAQSDFKGAIIQIKNALQVDPGYVPALLLAGEIYSEMGQTVDAEHAYSEAMLLGADRGQVALLLAKTYLQQRKYSALLRNLPLENTPVQQQTDMVGLHAQAYIGLGRLDDAQSLLSKLRESELSALEVSLAQVTLALRRGRLEQAERIAEQLKTDFPADTRSWNSFASIAHARGRPEAAVIAYRHSVELEPKNSDARVALVGLLIDLGRDNEVVADLEYLAEHSPRDPRAAYFRGLVAARGGDTDTEKEQLTLAATTLDALPADVVGGDPKLLMVGALAHYGLGDLEQALEYLEPYIRAQPDQAGAKYLYASVLLGLGEDKRVIKTLTPLLARHGSDPQLLSLLAAAYSRQGQHNKAATLLQQVEGAGEGDLGSDLQLARSWIASGNTRAGIDLLERIRLTQPDNLSIQQALAIAHAEQGNLEEARELAQALLVADESNVVYRSLMARVELASGDVAGAEKILRDVLAEQPNFVSAYISLARILAARGEIGPATELLDAADEIAADNVSLLLARVDFAKLQGSEQDALRWAEKAVTAQSSYFPARRVLVEAHLAVKDFDAAERAARDASAAWPGNLAAQALLGQTLAAVNKPKEARLVYKRMVKQSGFDAESLYRIAILQANVQALDEARYTLFKALEGDQHYLPAREAYIRIHLRLREFGEAVKQAEHYRQQHPDSSSAHMLLGEALLGAEQFEAADSAFTKAQSLTTDPAAILGRYKALSAQQDNSKAEQVLREYFDTGGEDARLKAAYSDLLIATGRWELARDSLLALVEERPGSASLQNNLAYVLQQLGDVRAIAVAERAHELAPTNPMINDTLGWILVEAGQAERGITYLREATARSAENPELRYHLAVALHALGRFSEARTELRRALRNPANFTGRKEAQQLLAKLNSELGD